MDVGNIDEREAFTTLDGSTIREIAGRATLPSRNQSLAEATVPPGGATTAHYHPQSEELYFFTAGRGRLRVAASGARSARATARSCRPASSTSSRTPAPSRWSCSAAARRPTPTRTRC